MILKPNHPFLKLSLELAELCKPLELFGIHHFTYLKQFSNGNKISLSNKPKWIEDYYLYDLYQSSLFEQKPEDYQASFNVWFGDYDLEVYKHGKLYFNTMHSISITEPHSDCCEFYLFATSPDNSEAIHYLNNHREILYHFILYLKDRGMFLFESAEKNKIILKSKEIDTTKIFKANYQKLEDHKKLFFRTTPIRRFVLEQEEFREAKLSQREVDCIYHLLHKKTALETAGLMNISSRTVESYFENIKTKLNCKNKNGIIEKLKYNKYLLALRET